MSSATSPLTARAIPSSGDDQFRIFNVYMDCALTLQNIHLAEGRARRVATFISIWRSTDYSVSGGAISVKRVQSAGTG